MGARRGSEADDDAGEEGEALILQRLSFDPTSDARRHARAAARDNGGGGGVSSAEDSSDEEVGDLESGFASRKALKKKGKGKATASELVDEMGMPLPASMQDHSADDKLGRPTWLRKTTRLSNRSPRVRICLACLALGFAAGLFALALVPALDPARTAIKGYASNLKDYVSGNHGGNVANKNGEHWYQGFPGRR